MIKHIKANTLRVAGHGQFKIRIAFPGAGLSDSKDSGLLTLGRFDDGHLKPGAFVGMHPHRNDEILTLMKQGTMLHRDSTGKEIAVTPHNVMMMNAGKGIYHEESIPLDRYTEDVRLLQIFIRPEKDDLPPEVQFADPGPISSDQPRLIAGPQFSNAPLRVRSNTMVYDLELIGKDVTLPKAVFGRSVFLLYIFSGSVSIVTTDGSPGNSPENISEGDYLIVDGTSVRLTAEGKATIVMFELDKDGAFSTNGMYSGIH